MSACMHLGILCFVAAKLVMNRMINLDPTASDLFLVQCLTEF